MKVFISWSGPLSENLGQLIRDWLPKVIQSVNPYFTPSDVEKGARWLPEITQQLDESKLGILCVTSDNISSDWLLFEAGVLSKQLKRMHVCPILFRIKPTDLKGPLKQFQATEFNMDEFRKLISVINDCQEGHKLEEKTLTAVFNKWWPDLESAIDKVLENSPPPTEPIRSERDIIEEILQLARKRDVNRAEDLHPNAVTLLLRSYISVHNMQVDGDGGYQETLDVLKEMRNPIMHIVKAHGHQLTKESVELYKQFQNLSYEAERRVPQNDDIPF